MMTIFTAVWGAEYIDYFRRGLLASFLWPRNKEIVSKSHWIFCCKNPSEQAQLRSAIIGLPASFDILPMELFDGIKTAVGICGRNKSPFLLAPPDNIFSDGSLENLLKIGAQPGVCVATAHVRVLPSYLNDSQRHSTSGLMVSHAWNHLHESWIKSEVKEGPSVSFHGGVSWRNLPEGLIAVQHRLPTVFLSNLIDSDISFFNRHNCLGVWDNAWPPECLINQQRYRYIGSSDVAFVVEVTHPHRNVPKIQPLNMSEPDGFFGGAVHNWVNREFVSVFRRG